MVFNEASNDRISILYIIGICRSLPSSGADRIGDVSGNLSCS